MKTSNDSAVSRQIELCDISYLLEYNNQLLNNDLVSNCKLCAQVGKEADPRCRERLFWPTRGAPPLPGSSPGPGGTDTLQVAGGKINLPTPPGSPAHLLYSQLIWTTA
jgi:hypothetical protein